MTQPDAVHAAEPREEDTAESFFGVQRLTNHWARPIGARSYYWFLTFDDHSELRELAQRCQSALLFPYYDLTASDDLHMTLERIAFEGEISEHQLGEVEDAAARFCFSIAPLEITVGQLGGTSGAIGFSAHPRQPINELRNSLRAATLTAHPAARLRPLAFDPHVTIAYCNTAGVSAAPAVATVKALNGYAVELTVTDVSLVLLGRLPRAYAWQTISRIPLLGSTSQRANH